MPYVGTRDRDVFYDSGFGDVVVTLEGNDVIYAGLGNDNIDAGTGDDLIVGQSHTSGVTQYWGSDYVVGGQGNDTINYYMTMSAVTIYGDDVDDYVSPGDDTISGGQAGDRIFGGGGDDQISGHGGADVIYGDTVATFLTGGHDWIWGGAGTDTIYGGGGMDHIYGGSHQDWMSGGKSTDWFVFNTIGDSGTSFASADIISDFNRLEDWIVMGHRGTTANYAEYSFIGGSNIEQNFNTAKVIANAVINKKDFVFVTDGTNGYLFADQDRNSTIDTAVRLVGLDQLSDFRESDITII